MIESLASARSDALDRLAEAARDRRSPMHTPAVATPDGELRIMVLRAFDPESGALRFHTDARSPKVAAIGAGSKVGVLFYDRDAGVQIRCRGRGRVEMDGAAVESAWSGSDPYARRCYLGDAPGTASEAPTSGLPDWVEGRKPTEEQLLPARRNFAILLVEIDEIDWYRLSHTGHRRALFRREDGWRGEWIAP